MKNWFLIREIKSKEGEVHFQRYRLFACPWFNIYIHKLCKSDEEKHPHDHPWSFITFILKGNYIEYTLDHPRGILRKWLHIVYHRAEDVHKFILPEEPKPTWTLVFTGPRKREWGYLTETGWFRNDVYREMKRKNEV